MDFSNYVRALLQQGRVVEARRLWDSVVEVIHNGTNPKLDVLGIPELPGLLRVLGVAAGPSRLFWPELGRPRLMFGRDTMAVRSVLNCWACRGRYTWPDRPRPRSPCGGAFRPVPWRPHDAGVLRGVEGWQRASYLWREPCWRLLRGGGSPVRHAACAFSGFRFPMIEDLINQHPSTVMFNGEKPKDLNGKGHWIGMAKERTQWALWGFPHWGITPCPYSLPTEQSPVLDDDLQFAVSLHATQKRLLASWRGRAFGTLPKLKQRWAPSLRSCLDSRLMQSPGWLPRETWDSPACSSSFCNGGTHEAPYGLMTGLHAVGTAPCYNIFPAQPYDVITLQDILNDTDVHNQSMIAKLRPGLHDEFLLSQSLVDADKGFGTYPMAWADLLRTTKGQPSAWSPAVSLSNVVGRSGSLTMLPWADNPNCPQTPMPTNSSCAMRCDRRSTWLQWQATWPRVTGMQLSPWTILTAAARTGQMHTATAPSPGRRATPVWSFGGPMNGNNLLSSSTTHCCLACYWPSQASTGTHDW